MERRHRAESLQSCAAVAGADHRNRGIDFRILAAADPRSKARLHRADSDLVGDRVKADPLWQAVEAAATWNREVRLLDGRPRVVFFNSLRSFVLTAMFGERFTALFSRMSSSTRAPCLVVGGSNAS
jgi:hypothetical protein